ncbi:MAG: hypothetical protein H7327_08280 [Herminiimonas sp.]|nr:hypothetical protein [Herminiimonas sp.]
MHTRATAHSGAPAGDGILLDALVRHGLAMPPGHPGLGLNATVEVRAALDALRSQPRARSSSLPSLVREICIDGTSRALEPALCLLRHGLIDPNGRDHEGKTVLHAIAAWLDDGTNYAHGYPTVAQRVAALVEVGVDVHATCHLHQLTALDYAVWREEDVVIEALVSAGAAALARHRGQDNF